MASTALNGALTPRAVFASAVRAAAQAATPASRSAIFSERSRVLRIALAFDFANAIASSSRFAPDDLIDDACSQGLRSSHWLAGRAHLDRHLGAAQAWQPLRAAGAGNDAEQHFRLADLGVGRHHAIVAGHGDFKAAAERRSVDRGDDRLGRVLDTQQPRVRGFGSSQRLFACFQGPEDLDVGARDERRAGADQDDRIDSGVGAAARDGGFDPFKNARS